MTLEIRCRASELDCLRTLTRLGADWFSESTRREQIVCYGGLWGQRKRKKAFLPREGVAPQKFAWPYTSYERTSIYGFSPPPNKQQHFRHRRSRRRRWATHVARSFSSLDTVSAHRGNKVQKTHELMRDRTFFWKLIGNQGTEPVAPHMN